MSNIEDGKEDDKEVNIPSVEINQEFKNNLVNRLECLTCSIKNNIYCQEMLDKIEISLDEIDSFTKENNFKFIDCLFLGWWIKENLKLNEEVVD